MTGSIADRFYDGNEVPERYLEGSREVVNTCFIIITSERGLCGSFNSNVIKQAEIEIEDDPNRSVLIMIGTKGKEYFEKRGKYITASMKCRPKIFRLPIQR